MMEVKIRHHKIARPVPFQKRAFFRHALWYLPTLLLLGLIPLAKQFPVTVELAFSRTWYQAVGYIYGTLTSLLPFSLLETSILFLTGLGVWLIVLGVRKHLRRQPTGQYWKRVLTWICRGVSLTVGVFMLFCGYNYYRLPLAESCGFSIRDSSPQELYDLCEELALRANELRAALPEDELGVMRLSKGSLALSRQAGSVFSSLSRQYDVLPAYHIKPKPVLSSWAMSMMQITGVFCPITFEANVNIDAPAYSIPATMCHELAHTRGFMREDEANFLGYLACVESGVPEFEYSGVMLALIHAQNRLYSADRTLYSEQASRLSDGVRRDFAYNNVYWARFEGPVAEVSTAVNNTYLQLNAQSDGVQSYGRMVDLLLADYRARHGLV